MNWFNRLMQSTSGPRKLLLLIGLKLGFVALVTVLTLYFMLGR